MKKIIFLISLFIFPFYVFASDITRESKIIINNSIASNKLTDNNENTYVSINKDDIIKISNDSDISGLYIIYEMKSQSGTIKNSNKNNVIGENNFLHEYINIKEKIGLSKELIIQYSENVKIGEIYILSEGELPEYVEIWDKACEEADLLLLSTHSDDEQLFFLGLIPTYVAKGAEIQVVYFTNHYDNPKRLHEQLHGLYTIGVRHYPIIGIIPDAYSESLNGAIKNIEKSGLTIDDAINYQVEMIRRFKPLVVVGHDESGEYSHGQHILNTHTLEIALEKTNDATYHEQSFKKFGLWNVPKTYLHLYKENQIVMDYDTPLEYFNGKTAYEVSKEGYSKHLSQQWTWFTKWINGSNNSYTKATDIKTYKPTEFGLYRTLVGNDINKDDMFENLILRKDEIKEDNNRIDENEENIINNNDKNYINEYIKESKNIIISTSFVIVGILIILIFLKKNHK